MKTKITFHAIDTLSRSSCPLYLSGEDLCFNYEPHARTLGKHYKVVLENPNTVVFYSRSNNLPIHRYVIAMDWHRTDDKLKYCSSTLKNSRAVERILHQRLLYMIKLINTSNI